MYDRVEPERGVRRVARWIEMTESRRCSAGGVKVSNMSSNEEVDMWKSLALVRSVTENADVEAAQLWLDGISLVIRTTDPLRSHTIGRLEERMLLSLIAHGVNTQLASYHLAVSGLYSQAISLARLCLEDCIAFWYALNFPEELIRFHSPDHRTPELNTMIQALESKHGRAPTAQARDWVKVLHKLSHVDHISVLWSWNLSSRPPALALVPTYSSPRFCQCVGDVAAVIPPLMSAANAFCSTVGIEVPQPNGPKEYDERLFQWAKQRLESVS